MNENNNNDNKYLESHQNLHLLTLGKSEDNSNINDNESNNSIKEENIIFKNKNKITEITKSSIDEKNKEFFNNCPMIYFLFKVFLLFEGQIMRILVQIGDLYFAGVITNIYLQIIIIQICASGMSNTYIKIYAFLSSFIFCFLMKSVISIAYWELYQLKWFKLNPYNTITDLLKIKLKIYHIRNIAYIINIIFGILFWLFIIASLTMSSNNGKLLDIINLIIFVIIPFLKYILIYLCYIYLCFRNSICPTINNENEENPFQYWMGLNNLINQGVIKIGSHQQSEETNIEENKLNCIEKFFFKDILFHIKCRRRILKIKLKTLIEIFFIFLSFSYCIYLFITKGITVESILFLTFIYLISLIISFQFSTPLWLINSVYRWHLKRKRRYDSKFHAKSRIFNERYSAFKVSDSLPLIISLFIWVGLITTIVNISSKRIFETSIEEKINRRSQFRLTNWKRDYFAEIKNIENSICFTDIHGLSLFKITSLAFASYLSDPENVKHYFEKTIFKEKVENITEMRFLDEKSKYSLVLMVNIDIPDQKPLTIFAIQGSLKRLDFWVDLEVFCSSAIFSIIRILTINKLESLTSRALTWLLSIPIRTLENFTLFKKYIESLTIEIDKEMKNINGKRNIIFTGHSLGGGMAKYLGLKYHKQNVAISGPGITPLEYKFTKDKNYYKYFKSNLIDIIPDNDIIPAVESTAGIKYRILCEKNAFTCHVSERTLCQIGAICRREDLSGDLCMGIFGKKKYEEKRDLAGIKSILPDEYN